MQHIEKVLKELRKKHGFSQNDFADVLKMTKGNYGRKERGQIIFSFEDVFAIFKFLKSRIKREDYLQAINDLFDINDEYRFEMKALHLDLYRLISLFPAIPPYLEFIDKAAAVEEKKVIPTLIRRLGDIMQEQLDNEEDEGQPPENSKKKKKYVRIN